MEFGALYLDVYAQIDLKKLFSLSQSDDKIRGPIRMIYFDEEIDILNKHKYHISSPEESYHFRIEDI